MNKFISIDELIVSLPTGLDRTILRVLSYHKGRHAAIGRNDLVSMLAGHGFHVSERQARQAISQLRKSGHLIGSAPGENGGYYLIDTQQEFDEFVTQEYLAKIKDMQETLAAMQRAAREKWTMVGQARMF